MIGSKHCNICAGVLLCLLLCACASPGGQSAKRQGKQVDVFLGVFEQEYE